MKPLFFFYFSFFLEAKFHFREAPSWSRAARRLSSAPPDLSRRGCCSYLDSLQTGLSGVSNGSSSGIAQNRQFFSSIPLTPLTIQNVVKKEFISRRKFSSRARHLAAAAVWRHQQQQPVASLRLSVRETTSETTRWQPIVNMPIKVLQLLQVWKLPKLAAKLLQLSE